MCKILIIETDQVARGLIREVILQSFKSISEIREVSLNRDTFQEYMAYLPDLVIMGDRHGDDAGMDFLEQTQGYSCDRIFLSGSEENVVGAIRFGVRDFLMFPIKPQELSQKLRKLQEKVKATLEEKCNKYFQTKAVSQLETIALRVESGLRWISVDNIEKVTREGKQCMVKLRGEVIIAGQTMHEMVRLLRHSGFAYDGGNLVRMIA